MPVSKYFLHDYEGYRTGLYYLRTVDKKEVDFLVTLDERPWFAVEAKLSDDTLSKPLLFFREKLSIPFAYQVVGRQGVDRLKQGIRIVSADRFLAGLI